MAIKNVHLEEELIKKEKLSAVGQATSMIAHDMKNVIGGMELGMELLEPELKDSAEALNILEMIRTSFGDCMALVNDILDFAGKREIVKRKIELSQIFDELVLKSGAYLKPLGIKLETSFERDILFDADRNKIYRVLFNLVKNSAEALQQSETDSPIIRFSASKKDGSLIICESDNGPGIPDSVKNTLFEAFVTAKTGGTGLGLAIVKQFVEAHGGRIKVLSPEKGAAFEISLPLRT
jgi:signal transduction histidine kinase